MAYSLPTAREVQEFDRNGVVCLRRPFGAGFPDLLSEAIDAWLADTESPSERVASQRGNGGMIVSMFLWKSSVAFRDIALGGAVAAVAAALLKESSVSFFNDNLFVKEPRCDVRVPWHQDVPYYPIRGSRFVTLWIAADDIGRASGGLEYVAGSHLWGEEYRPVHFTPGKGDYEGDLPPVPHIDARRAGLDILGWDLKPGDCVAHHGLTLHTSGPNPTALARRALAVRYVGRDVHGYERDGAISLPPDHPFCVSTGSA